MSRLRTMGATVQDIETTTITQSITAPWTDMDLLNLRSSALIRS